MTAIAIETPSSIGQELLEAFSHLLPQLSRTAALTRETLADLFQHSATTLLVARLDGRLVGALTLVIFPLPTGRRAHIEDVVVDQSARGQGVGAALVRAAIAIAERHGVRTVDLTSRPGREAAIRLYISLGFVRRDSHVYRYEPPGDVS